MCGGPSDQQKQAASSQQALASQQLQLGNQALSDYNAKNKATTDFWNKRLADGLPYFNQEADYATSSFNKNAAPVRAAQRRRLSGFGSDLPSGFAEASTNRTNTDLGRDFDSRLLQLIQAQEQEKEMAARGLDPSQAGTFAQGGYSGAGSGYNSIMQAPLKNEFWGNLVGGLIQGGARVGAAALG